MFEDEYPAVEVRGATGDEAPNFNERLAYLDQCFYSFAAFGDGPPAEDGAAA